MSIVKQGLKEMHIEKEVFKVLRSGFKAEMLPSKHGAYTYKLKTLLNNTQLTIGYWAANHLYVLWDDGDVMDTFYDNNKNKIEDLSISDTKELFNQAQDLAEKYNFDLNDVSEENFDFQMYCMIDDISDIFDIYVSIEMFKQDLRQVLINLTKSKPNESFDEKMDRKYTLPEDDCYKYQTRLAYKLSLNAFKYRIKDYIKRGLIDPDSIENAHIRAELGCGSICAQANLYLDNYDSNPRFYKDHVFDYLTFIKHATKETYIDSLRPFGINYRNLIISGYDYHNDDLKPNLQIEYFDLRNKHLTCCEKATEYFKNYFYQKSLIDLKEFNAKQ